MNYSYIGVFVPVLSASFFSLAILIYTSLYFCENNDAEKFIKSGGSLFSRKFAPVFLSAVKKIKFLSQKLLSEKKHAARAIQLLHYIPVLVLLASAAGLGIYIFQLINVDLKSFSSAFYSSEDMSVWQKISAVFFDPAGRFLMLLFYVASLLVIVLFFLKKHSLDASRFIFHFSILLSLLIIPMLFRETYQPFRSFEQSMKSGEGLSRNSYDAYEILSRLFFYAAHSGVVFWMAANMSLGDKFAAGIKKPLLSFFIFFAGISLWFDFYGWIFRSSKAVAPLELMRYTGSFLSFSAGVYILHLNEGLLRTARSISRIQAAMFSGSLLSILIVLFASSEGDGCGKENSGFCAVLEYLQKTYVYYFAVVFIAAFVFFLYIYYLVLKTDKKEAKRYIKIYSILTFVSLSVVSALYAFFSLKHPFSGLIIVPGIFLPAVSLLLVFIWIYHLLEGAGKFSEPGRMQSNFMNVVKELSQNNAFHGMQLLNVSILALLSFAGGLFFINEEKYSFQYYLTFTPDDSSDYVHYRSEDKFYHEGYEISPADVYVSPFFNDNASPKNPMHLIIEREIQLRIHVPMKIRNQSESSSRPPLYFAYDENFINEETFLKEFPSAPAVAVQKYFPVIDSSRGELKKNAQTKEPLRVMVNLNGMSAGLVDVIAARIENYVLDKNLDINHLFEYYYYYTNHGNEFYAGVFPRKMIVNFSVWSFQWFSFFYLSGLLFIFSFILIMPSFFRSGEAE